MHFWNSLPLFRLVIPFILGILLSDYLFEQWIYRFIPILLIALIYIHFVVRWFRFRWLFGAVCSFLMFVLGLSIFQFSLDSNDDLYFAHTLKDNSVLMIECIEHPVEKANSYKMLSEVISVDDKPAKGKLLVYLQKNIDSIAYGDRMLISSEVKEISSPSNPYQFNFKKHQNIRGITHQVYVSEDEFIRIEKLGGNYIIKNINAFRLNLLEILSASELDSNQLSVCSALLLGDKSRMSQELKQIFSKSGVIHVLAVSGLHVGIIFLLVSKLLVFMNRTGYLRILKLLILLICLWSYAFITALSPSVMRAATMFSFIAIANVMRRQTNIYNTLAASAFLLLIVEPNMIFEVGFQLSYLAVLGIVSIYPIIYSLLLIKSKWIDALWQLICVSIAAQIATFPLGVYYFHQFPNYFLLANVLVIPLIPFVIYFGLFYLMLFDYTFLSEPILIVLKFILDNLFLVLQTIQQFPQTVSSFLHLHSYEVLLLYGAIGFSLFSIHFKRGSHFVLSLVCFVFLQISQWNDSKIKENRSQIVFYSVNKHSVFGFVEKDKGFFLADSDFIKDKSSQNFNLYNHWSYLGLNNPQLLELDSSFQNQSIWKEDCHIQFGNKKLVLVNKNFELKWCEVPIEIDYCLVSHYFPVDKLLQIYRPKQIILDANLPSYTVKKLSEECHKLKILTHDLKSKGALLVDLKD